MKSFLSALNGKTTSLAVSFQAAVVLSRANDMMGKTALDDNRKIIL